MVGTMIFFVGKSGSLTIPKLFDFIPVFSNPSFNFGYHSPTTFRFKSQNAPLLGLVSS
jgi:hypothetical protein